MSCSKISNNLVLAACKNSLAAIEADIVLINFDDVDRDSSSVTGNVLSTLALKSSTYGYRFTSHKNAFEATVALNKGTYLNSFVHGAVARVFTKTQDAKDQLNKLANGKVIAIVKNSDNQNDETKYEVYGWDNGLVMSDLQAASTDADGVLYTFNLSSDDNARESQLPLSYFSTTLAATETALESLIFVPTP